VATDISGQIAVPGVTDSKRHCANFSAGRRVLAGFGDYRNRHGRADRDYDSGGYRGGRLYDVFCRAGGELCSPASHDQNAGFEFSVADRPHLDCRGLRRSHFKRYIYFAMGFSLFVEMLNLRLHIKSKPVSLHQRFVASSGAQVHSK
jgi:hypothetical protein